MDKPSLQLKEKNSFALLLFFSVFVVATCGLIYELVAGTLASYLLGDSVTQFSMIIGVYLFSMGIGSFLSRYFTTNLIAWFIRIEILIGIIGGASATILFLLFNEVDSFRIILFGLVSLIGTLVGLEIPLLMAILKDQYEFRDLVSRVFSFDYIGALFASIVFPLLLVPHLGLIKTSFFFGILNVVVALRLCYVTTGGGYRLKLLKTSAWVALAALLFGFVWSERITQFAEERTYQDRIVFAVSSPYQRIILTNKNNDYRLFLNGNLQFSSLDEYRYHEALVHPAMNAVVNPKNILVLGGGDGMAARELLKYSSVEKITLVDLDQEMTELFQTDARLLALNDSALIHPKVNVINGDAFMWLKENTNKFDVIIIDFPDPSNFSIGKLYSLAFYETLRGALNEKGMAVIQSTSPYFARKSYWCIEHTCREAGFATVPYHAYVPSFGEWGYLLVSHEPLPVSFIDETIPLRYLNSQTWQQMQQFAPDMSQVETEVNLLNNQILVQYFEEEWGRYD